MNSSVIRTNRLAAPLRALAGLTVVIVCTLLPTTGRADIDITLDDANRAVYDSLHEARIDESRSYAVQPGSVWDTPLGRYVFESGTLSFLQSVRGRPSGCYFKGKGQFEYVPPDPLERHQLERFCDDSVLSTAVTEFYARFFDTTTARTLLNCANADIPEEPAGNQSRLRWFEKIARIHLILDLGAIGWAASLDTAAPPPWLYICPILKGQDRLHFVYDATRHEPVTVWERPGGLTEPGIVDMVCSYRRPSPEDDIETRDSLLDGGLRINDYVSTVELSNVGDMALDVTVHCRAQRNGLVVLPFTAAPDLKIDSIQVDSRNATFIYEDEGAWLLVHSPRTFAPGEEFAVRFFYRGKHLLEKLPWGNFYIRHTTRWLPRTGVRQRAHYTTTFHYPKHYDVISVGNQLSDTLIDDTRISTWESIDAVSYISFNYGGFDRTDYEMADGTVLQIYRGKNHRDGLFSSNMTEIVTYDIEGALQLFSLMFGPYPWTHLAATEIPGNHGQGFPQMLHLGYSSFDVNKKGVTDAFRAHEVAHQWFGHIVGWASYRDQWLSEGFAEYAGAMFVQVRNEDNDEFLKIVKRWRDQILERGGHDLWHDGPQVAPIALGYRCSSNQSPASYYHLVYGKGAYVLHMLRYMMYDFLRDSDLPFADMMTDFVTTYTDRDASTEDFQRIVEKHTHQSMDWFFDQWVYGTQIPRFEYRWEREERDDGRWVVHGRIDQFDASPPFRVYMPVTIDFGDGMERTFVQLVDGESVGFDTPPFDRKPRDVRFNDLAVVLCKEKVVKKP